MKLDPVGLWRGNEGAAKDFHAIVNGANFRAAVSFALAEYQYECSHLEEGAAMLRGANGIIVKLLNMAESKQPKQRLGFQLPNPEELTTQQ